VINKNKMTKPDFFSNPDSKYDEERDFYLLEKETDSLDRICSEKREKII